MNVSQLLAYKPQTPLSSSIDATADSFAKGLSTHKRQGSRINLDEANGGSKSKNARRDDVKADAGANRLNSFLENSETQNQFPTITAGSSISNSFPSSHSSTENHNSSTAQKTIAELQDEDPTEPLEISDLTVKRMILNLEKRALKNQEIRVKYSDNPQKFVQSELDLFEAIQELQVIGTEPQLYPILVELNCVDTLLQLLSHDNVDICVAVVDLLHELCESDTVAESPANAAQLMDALLAKQLVSVLLLTVARFNEQTGSKDEIDAVHNFLGIVENLIEYDPGIAADIAKQGLLNWLLKRIQKTSFDANKLYTSEIISILLTNVEDNIALFGELNGIDIVLQQLSIYKRIDPSTREECEMMQNLFDSLCSALAIKPNQDRFLKGEGPQLMILMLRFKKLSRNNALRVLDYSVSGEQCSDTCNKLVDNCGLRYLFPLLMRPPHRRLTDSRRVGPSTAELEEHIVNVAAGLLRHCTGSKKQRVLDKFCENHFEKTERLVELHFKYFDATKESDREIEKRKANPALWTATNSEEMEEEVYDQRLIGGLFVLQQIDTMILEIAVNGGTAVKDHILRVLRVKSVSPRIICRIVQECSERMGDAAIFEKRRLKGLLDKFDSLI